MIRFIHGGALPSILVVASAMFALGACDDEPAGGDVAQADVAAEADIANDQAALEVDAAPDDVADTGDQDAAAETTPNADTSEPEVAQEVTPEVVMPPDTQDEELTDGSGDVPDATVDAELDGPSDVPDTGDTDDTDDTDVSTDTDTDTDGGPGTTYSVTGGPYGVQPGEESTICVVRNLGNPEAARVAAIHTHLAPGSHHMIVSRVNGNATTDQPQECFPFDGGLGGSDTLFIAEQPEASLVYPEGAALEIGANQLVRIEIHYLNYYPQSIDVTGVVDFELVPPSSGETSPAEFVFDGSFSLYLPPNQETTKVSTHNVPNGAHVFALTSHTHKLGIKATIHRTLPGGQQGELLHESLSWADPPLDQFDPPLVFAPGEGLKLTCEYNNPTDNGVSFGLSANDEMCFLWAHYFIP